jgi:hypothetical protein
MALVRNDREVARRVPLLLCEMQKGDDMANEYNDINALMQQAATAAPGASAAAGAGDLCKYWPAVKALLEIIVGLPIPELWKTVLRTFIKIVDGICAGK